MPRFFKFSGIILDACAISEINITKKSIQICYHPNRPIIFENTDKNIETLMFMNKYLKVSNAFKKK